MPVAADGASFPSPEQLPNDLASLSQQSGIELRGTTFDADMALLLDRLTPLIRRGSMAVSCGRRAARKRQWIVPGGGDRDWFQDLEGGPQLVVVPAGRFTIGSPLDEPGREPYDAGSEVQVEQILNRPFAIGRAPVTVAQFNQFVAATGKEPLTGAYRWSEAKDDYSMVRGRSWRDLTGDHPVVCISWVDAMAYVTWLSEVTGWTYRLPSSAEWEYAARSGTKTPFHFGGSISARQANYDARTIYGGAGSRGEASDGPLPVLRFEPNAWGLYQVHGNVWEMCQDRWPEDATLIMCCGGSFEDKPNSLRSAMRSDVEEPDRYVSVGFRVVREID